MLNRWNFLKTGFYEGINLPQQIDGNGLHVSFSISWHAMGKTGPEAYEGLRMLMPEHYPQPDDA